MKKVGSLMILTYNFNALMFFPEKTVSVRTTREHFKMIDHFSCDSKSEHRQEIAPLYR
jgi:hypothetical protein